MSVIYYVIGRLNSFTTTSFTPKSFTTSIDLQEPVSVTLKNFIKANWPTTSMLKASQIKFGNKWFDNFGSYQVHLVEPHTREYTADNTTIGWQIKGILAQVDIHIFVRRNTLTQPPEIGDMKRTITNIINVNRRSLPITIPDANHMHVVREYDVIDKQPLATLWHSVLEANINFYRATSS